MLADKSAAPLPLSWQPPMPAPVINCRRCPRNGRLWWTGSILDICREGEGKDMMLQLYAENKDGITPTCPMWQQQNKEVK